MSENNTCCGHSATTSDNLDVSTSHDAHRQNVRDAYAQLWGM